MRRVLNGHIYVSDAMQDRLLFQHVGRTPHATSAGGLHALSNRELEVFELIGRGRTTRQIAEELVISPKTVESHRARIKDKLSIDTHTELMRQAIQWVETIGDPL
jgi:DNA-binding NarL/FixJ family response regulator